MSIIHLSFIDNDKIETIDKLTQITQYTCAEPRWILGTATSPTVCLSYPPNTSHGLNLLSSYYFVPSSSSESWKVKKD
jgi:hypothetical protein